MVSFKARFKALFGAERHKPQVEGELSFVESVTQGPLSLLRDRQNWFHKASLGFFGANVLALVLWGVFSLVAHQYRLDAGIDEMQVPASVFQAVDAATSKAPSGDPLSEFAKPLGLKTLPSFLISLLPLMAGVVFVAAFVRMFISGEVTTAISGVLGGIMILSVPAVMTMAGLYAPDSTSDSLEFRQALQKNKHMHVRAYLRDIQLPEKERNFVDAQIELFDNKVGTPAQKAVAQDIRKGERLTDFSGQWAFALETAAGGPVESPLAVSYMTASKRSEQVWREAGNVARNVVMACALASFIASTFGYILRRRIERISGMLELLA
ncbi:hypothetical protein [Pseudomonas sp. DP-17]|uniref:hypothetical protein n=1 Tax=Pseudomonas sp. DP-17 TaxID=1580486 RepID=UPI001EFB5D04|nr:hypothetical protein [Pseudomonas sp. DP-17]MCG8910931.1 hypothetical protein [Pseudomonas sp. DP-17]